MRGPLVVLAVGLAAVACNGGVEPPEAVDLEVVQNSDNQRAPAGSRLAEPLAVTVLGSDGVRVPRGAVRWTVVDGAGAALSDTLTVADGNGRAEVALTLGPTPGEYRVRAELSAVAGQAVVLTATATEPLTLDGVAPASFAAGDTAVLTGRSLSGVRVTVGGSPALVLSATSTTVRFVAPVCVVPGPVQVRAALGTAASNAVTATYVAPAGPAALAPGEYASIEPSQLAGCASFAPPGAVEAEYILAPQSATGAAGLTADYRLSGDSVVVTLSARARAPRELPLAVRFHDMLRAQERELARRPRPASPPSPLLHAAALEQVQVGDRRTFQVCNAIPCSQVEDFTAVDGEARWVGSHAAIFLDRAAPEGFTVADFEALGALFDEQLYDVDTRAFGAESDVDGNGVVAILFTTMVNSLTDEAQCGTSIITGYFFGVDIDPAFRSDVRSNKGEVFYAIAPDPDATVGCRLEVDVVRRLVPVTFVHEFQHMISYNQHVLVRGGDTEVLWLNEGMSHIAEELAGLRFEAMGDDQQFSRFAVGNLFNAYLFLENPGAVFLFPQSGTGTLEERGAGWLFLRWLIDRHGEDLTRRLVETRLTGTDNVEAASGETLSQVLPQWFLANYVSDLPGFTAPPELTFTTWRLRTTYAGLNTDAPTRFTRPFPIEPTAFDPATTVANGTLRSGSGEYFRVVLPAGGPGFTVRLTAAGGGAISNTAAPRLNVIRVR